MASTYVNVNKMFCCVPECGTDTWRSTDPSITFHPFPPTPKMATKWIQQINSALIPKSKPMWFPRANSVVCSKHFQPADLNKGSLKPQAIPIIFSSNLIDVNETLSDLQTSSAKPIKSPSIDNKIGPAVPASAHKTIQISGRTVKPHAIKNILDRASILFARNMAITKCLEDTRSDSPTSTNENECSEAEVPDTLHSYSLPELNLDKALSLATLQTKRGTLNKKLKQKIVLDGPFQIMGSKSSSKTPNFSPSDSAGSKTSVTPNKSLQMSSKIQKRKHEDGSNTELIKIAPNKFLKIQRLSGKESIPSTNTPLLSVPNEKPENDESEDNVIMDSNVDDAYNSSNDHEPSLAPETDKICNAAVKLTTIQSVPNKQPVLFLTNRPLDHFSNNKLASSIPHNPTPIKKLKCGNASLKKTKKLNKRSPAPLKAPETDKMYNAAVKSTTIQSVSNKQPVLFTNMPLGHFSNNKLASLVLCNRSKNSLLEEKNASLKKKIEALEEKCHAQQQKLMEPMQKKFKIIQEESSKGDASATYILEQISAFSSAQKLQRWSDSTLLQCALLCRKGAYAYELFRKADFFKLPTFTTIERYIRKNPNLTLPSDANTLHPGYKTNNVGKNINSPSPRGIVYDKPNNLTALMQNHTNRSKTHTTSISNNEAQSHEKAQHSEPPTEITTIPVTVDTSSSELREIVLETGEVIQCYSHNICTGADGYQYYIIPADNSDDGQGHNIKNSEKAQVLPEQEQIVYIENLSHQLHSSETEVTTSVLNINRTESH